MNDLVSPSIAAAVARVAEAAAGRGSSSERANDTFGALNEMTGCDAVELAVWDPAARHHRCVAAVEYTPEELAYADSPAFSHDDGYRLARRSRWPLRMSEVLAHDPPLERIVSLPRFGDGLTACLFTRELRYTGVLNLSRFRPEPIPDSAVAAVDLVAPALAAIADCTADLRALARDLEPVTPAVLLHDDGSVSELPGRPRSRLLARGTATLERISSRVPDRAGTATFMTVDPDGRLWRVHATRGREPWASTVLIALSPPDTSLTARELEVLTMVAAGRTNPEIASALRVSRHTVATHIAHILDKLGAPTRAAAAAHALRDGLLLAGISTS